jgi:5-methylcytosine-specific restriction endonuclease McrA
MGSIFDKVLKKDEKASDNGWYKCAKCGKKFRKADMDVDHTKPRSNGGGDDKANLQLICKYCNRSK